MPPLVSTGQHVRSARLMQLCFLVPTRFLVPQARRLAEIALATGRTALVPSMLDEELGGPVCDPACHPLHNSSQNELPKDGAALSLWLAARLPLTTQLQGALAPPAGAFLGSRCNPSPRGHGRLDCHPHRGAPILVQTERPPLPAAGSILACSCPLQRMQHIVDAMRLLNEPDR